MTTLYQILISMLLATAIMVALDYFDKGRPTVIMDPVTKQCYEVINGDYGCNDIYGKRYNVQWERRE